MKTNRLLITLILVAALLLASCASQARVGALQTESKSVELGDARSVRTQINLGAGDLKVTGGAEKLLEAEFNYNVARLKPIVEYTNGTLVVKQPDTIGLPDLRNITDFRYEWGLRLNDEVPMDLSVNAGGGSGDLKLAGLSLTRLKVNVGAGTYTFDLSGDWARNLDVTIETGGAYLTVKLPKDVGARVTVDRGANFVKTSGLTQDGNVYTNAAYGVSGVTMQVNLRSGIGQITLEVEDEAAVAND